MNGLRGKGVVNYSHEFLKAASELNKTIAILDFPHPLIQVTMKKLEARYSTALKLIGIRSKHHFWAESDQLNPATNTCRPTPSPPRDNDFARGSLSPGGVSGL